MEEMDARIHPGTKRVGGPIRLGTAAAPARSSPWPSANAKASANRSTQGRQSQSKEETLLLCFDPRTPESKQRRSVCRSALLFWSVPAILLVVRILKEPGRQPS